MPWLASSSMRAGLVLGEKMNTGASRWAAMAAR